MKISEVVFLFLLGLGALSFLMWLSNPGDVVETTERVEQVKHYSIQVGQKLPYEEHLEDPEIEYYVFAGSDTMPSSSGSETQTIKLAKRIPHKTKGGTTYEVQELSIEVKNGEQLPVVDTSRERGWKFVKLYVEGTKKNSLELKAEEIVVEERRENEGPVKRFFDKAKEQENETKHKGE